jgi:hypothetical protein
MTAPALTPGLLARVREVAEASKAAEAALSAHETLDDKEWRLIQEADRAQAVYRATLSPDVALALVEAVEKAERRAHNHESLWRYVVSGVASLTGVAYDQPSDVTDCVRQLLADAELFRGKLAAEQEAHRVTREALEQARKAVDDAARIRVAGATEMGQCARLMDAMAILDAAVLDRSPR